ncbi:transmembrane protein 200A [Nematolebias whitei]|uniref:transmembrane protein 200A n=1 Tax=Nematolebias whitei TaxID=451745 RepID=UPI001898F87C|nr:transmembrane protein 200A [Nematolebias whitei]
MKTQKCQGVAPTLPPCRRKPRFHLRGRKKKDRVIQGRLRIRSLPGAFLILGGFVVALGTALAVAGYWPYRLSRSSIPENPEEEQSVESQTSAWNLGAKGLLSSAGLLHGERMKLLGPVIMGVGLFILICANTVLYENRDRETQMLLAQMHNIICSVSAAVPSAGLRDAAANSMTKHYQWVSTLPATHLNILCLQQLTSSEPLLQTRYTRDHTERVEGKYQQALLQTDALHHQESEPPPSMSSSCSNLCNNCPTDSQTSAEWGTNSGPQTRPLLKLNVSLVSSSSMSNLELEDADVPAAQPRRCHSMSHRTCPYQTQTGVSPMLGLCTVQKESQINPLEVPRGETGSQVCVNIPGQFVDAMKVLSHQSWPRLDLGGGRRYLKLENKEDSVDKLLDQLEQQCSSCEKSFGSGPFQ